MAFSNKPIVCIIAGGEGSRLWPLSTSKTPKQTLNLFGEKTQIQSIFNLVSKITDNIFVISEKSHSNLIKRQLPKLRWGNLIVEPIRKGTLHCTILALLYIKKKFKDKKNNIPIFFVHADHFFSNNNSFLNSIKEIVNFSKKNKKIFIGGKKPNEPNTKYGYVKCEKINNLVYSVKEFTEKPNIDVATEYFKSGLYFWNEGFFCGSINTFFNEFKNNDYLNKILNLFLKSNVNSFYKLLDNNSIEKTFFSKCNNLLLYEINYEWSDIGTYGTLWKMMEKDINNNVLFGKNIMVNSSNTNFIRNDNVSSKICVIGVENLIIVFTKNGVLISNKNYENEIGNIVKNN